MSRAVSNRLLNEKADFIQIESDFKNFRLLTEDASNTTPSTDLRAQRYVRLGDIREATSKYE